MPNGTDGGGEVEASRPQSTRLLKGLSMIKTRIEYDSLGELHIPQDAYWGIHTGRAVQNFPISGRCVNSALIRALAKVKSACSQANLELGYLDETKGSAILESCREIADREIRRGIPG